MPTSIEVKVGAFSWLTYERRNWLSLVVVAGMAGYAAANGHTTQNRIAAVSEQLGQKQAEVHKLNTVVIPQLKAATHCEAARGDKAVDVAHQAIRGALVDTAPIPSPSAIPADNCPHPGTK